MRKYHAVLGGLAMLALVSMVMLTGCPSPEEPEMIVDDPDYDFVEDDIVGEPETVADLMRAWPSSFVMEVDFEDKETGEKESATMTMLMGDDGPAKIKMEVPDEAGAFILDHQNMMMYSWDEASGQGMKMSLADIEEDTDMEGPANPYGEVDPGTAIIGSETIDGVDCWVVEYVSTEDETATIYYAKENGLVQRIETDTMIANYTYSDIGTVSEDAFEVPDNIELMDLSDLGDLGGLEGLEDLE